VSVRKLKFGDHIRKLREECGFGQRQLARLLEISASYLNDIEQGKRAAPSTEIVRAMVKILEADAELLFDLAGTSKNAVPTDIDELVRQCPELKSLLRTIKALGLKGAAISEMEKKLFSSNVKSVIIAAGMGSRLGSYTENLPKCMLSFGSMTLLQRQIEAYRECGITDIALIRGYKKEKINYENIRYYDNDDFETNNILNSLFYAEEELNGNLIVSYSDILFENQVVQRLLQSHHDISIVVDIDWQGYYVGRQDHPIEEAENVVFDANNNVVEIGKIMTDKHDVHGEFIGMMKFSPRGIEIFKKHFKRSKALYWDKPFQRAAVFQKAYLTDMIQEMVDFGMPVHCVIIERGWKEIDTGEDYEKALREFES
jgi:L-glutamine-phosphate cytidylyltransferase